MCDRDGRRKNVKLIPELQHYGRTMSSCCPQRGYASPVNYLTVGGSQLFLERHGYVVTRRHVWPTLQPNTLKVHQEPQRQPYPPIGLQPLAEQGTITGVTRPWPYNGEIRSEW